MKPPEIINTEHLTLRNTRIDDAEAIFESYAQDSEVTRFLTWRPHRTLDQTRSFRQSRIDAWHDGSEFTWGILLNGKVFVGCIALRIDRFKADVGYVIARPHWNHGYATEALQAIVDWCLGQPDIFRVWGVCDINNIASTRVFEKVGMTKEGILHRWVVHPNVSSQPRDCFCYAIVKE